MSALGPSGVPASSAGACSPEASPPSVPTAPPPGVGLNARWWHTAATCLTQCVLPPGGLGLCKRRASGTPLSNGLRSGLCRGTARLKGAPHLLLLRLHLLLLCLLLQQLALLVLLGKPRVLQDLL